MKDNILRQKVIRSNKKKHYTPVFTILSTSHATIKAQPSICTPIPAPALTLLTELNIFSYGTIFYNCPWQTYKEAYCTMSNSVYFYCKVSGYWQVYCLEYQYRRCNLNQSGHTTSNCLANSGFWCRFCKHYKPCHILSEYFANPNWWIWEYTPDPLNNDTYNSNDWALINESVESHWIRVQCLEWG